MVVRCSSCGREIPIHSISYVKGDVIVCRSCFPDYYVRNVCPIVNRRLRGEQHIACTFCRYKGLCDEVVKELREVL